MIKASSTASAEERARRALRESIEVKARVLEEQLPTITRLGKIMIHALRAGRKLVLFGNGGSAADAQHVVTELVGQFQMKRDSLAAIALTTDTSLLTALGNDRGFDQLFSRQVHAMVQAGDVAVGISTSGNSLNVINGILAAKEKGATTVGFTGGSGGKIKDLVDICCCVPSDNTARIQEAQITIWHALCEIVEQEMFGG